MSHMHAMVNPLKAINIEDYGDAPADPLSTHRSNVAVRAMVREIAEVEREDGQHVIPFVIGDGPGLGDCIRSYAQS